jgi:hypothetical protein
MLRAFFSALSRLFRRKSFGGTQAIDSAIVDKPEEWTNRQY